MGRGKKTSTPFYDAIARIRAQGPRFYVPGHKGNGAAIPAFGGFLQWDITEIDGAYDLSCPKGPLLESQENMARAFGAATTLYSAAGSSSCVQAMLATFCPPGTGVLVARGVHVSAMRGLALLHIVPHWLPLHMGQAQAGHIAAALDESGAKAVFITSIDYYGRRADIAEIAKACHQRGAYLLCDNAQGAHLAFLPQGGHPLHQGADAVCDSAHKTLPALTGAALLHLRSAGMAANARQMLNLFSSTSPSYPVLLSLDLCAGGLLAGRPNFSAAAARLAAIAGALYSIVLPCQDPLRLVLCPALLGIDATAFNSGLAAAGVAAELFDGERLVFMASPYNDENDFCALEKALLQQMELLAPANAANVAPKAPPVFLADILHEKATLPRVHMPMHQALFAKKESLPTIKAIGRVAAGLCVPCPPGVPPVAPGEEIGPQVARALLAGGIFVVEVLR